MASGGGGAIRAPVPRGWAGRKVAKGVISSMDDGLAPVSAEDSGISPDEGENRADPAGGRCRAAETTRSEMSGQETALHAVEGVVGGMVG